MGFLSQIRAKVESATQKCDDTPTLKPISVPEVIIATTKSSRDNENTYAYNQLMHKQKMLAFRKTRDADVFNNNIITDFTNNFYEDLDESIYQKTWGRLNKEHKINRLLKYVMTLSSEMKLSDSTTKSLRKLLISGITNNKITRKDDVKYDSEKGEIISIPSLDWGEDGNTPCFRTQCTIVKVKCPAIIKKT